VKALFAQEKVTLNTTPRVVTALIALALVFFILALRMWYLQVVRGEYFAEKSENNRLKTVFIPPQRGEIHDREGRPLAQNRASFNIELVWEESPDPEATLSKLAEVLDRTPEEIQALMERDQRARRRYEPKIVMRDVSRDQVARVAAARPLLPGVAINYFPARSYLYGDLASHVIGYIREINADQLRSAQFAGSYRLGDLVGQYGLEGRWERLLQGKRGRQHVIVNARGVKIQDLPSFERARAGHNLALTLDFDVQRAADMALNGLRGAVVAMDPNTGEILAMSSSPRFDPNIFTGELSSEQWQELIAGRARPMSNRVVQGVYPPGSVFKIIMGIAGLAEGVITPRDTVNCPGFYSFGGRRYHCHRRQGHGSVDLRRSLVVSCDVYFYILGQRLGVDRIHDYAVRFGLGSPTGLELVQEQPGLIPSTQWKRRHFAGTEQERWFPGETLSVAIGQGATQSTPLQMAVAMAALVNGGKVLKPYLVKGVRSSDGAFVDDDFGPTVLKELDVNPGYLKVVQDSLKDVIHGTGGTGWRFRMPDKWNIQGGGKTGTSQVVALTRLTDDEFLNHHAWFVGYAPADKPEILVSVLIENGGHGGVAAAPVARQVTEAYFAKKLGLLPTVLAKKEPAVLESDNAN